MTTEGVQEHIRGGVECVGGALLCSLPLLHAVQAITVLLEFGAALCGFVIGLHGVFRLVRLYRNRT